MEEKNAFENYSEYIDKIIKKAKEEYKYKGVEPELVYKYMPADTLQLVHYCVDGLHLYCYDEIFSYISKDALFDNGKRNKGVVYLHKFIEGNRMLREVIELSCELEDRGRMF